MPGATPISRKPSREIGSHKNACFKLHSPGQTGGRIDGSMKFKAIVTVMLKKSVLDPQGAAVERALKSYGHSGLE